ncbi:MAG TPA: hypothetical protein PLN63_01810 [Paludibacteraceae bacterium]|jgi:hypothetical protein|nr:hypothetical protein [Paludibacteraceae bacterium]HOU67030.1 hypothetical protein [Paludibacteraceae bacterium]HPH62346.1 hypothetical protein [Paludibacteraceae bacterium]HQF50244.1 hypothetical protein [Paludibacteraceae bacterium]HQJ90864.1 hypothetical protein [Paludibacteraceae bacterium]
MKAIKFILVAATLIALMGSCKSKACPGYGEVQNDQQQTEQKA